ncbi:MAG: hypothetical protein CSA81_12475 [Acidobacteria bacterium]|nr:MAG: hypothetical protein CSA81_12475 [Acidobacteriota bacterium]
MTDSQENKSTYDDLDESMWGSKVFRTGLLILLIIIIVFFSFLGWYWSREPDIKPVKAGTFMSEKYLGNTWVTGQATTAALMHCANTLLDKPGGYLTNDKTPPSLFLDNMPNWEFGVLVQIRDLARSMRNDMSRSRSQSKENAHLAEAEPLFNFKNDSWLFPPTESQYRKANKHLEMYFHELGTSEQMGSQFFARADNLREWLTVVEKRLGDLSQRLSASVARTRINTDLAGDATAEQSTQTPKYVQVKTPWLEIDDVFYESRGATWALIHFFKAIEIDFQKSLEKKSAIPLVQQIIRELEGSQRPLGWPVVLNGGGFGLFANHSLVMASYISRANAAVIDLRELLQDG